MTAGPAAGPDRAAATAEAVRGALAAGPPALVRVEHGRAVVEVPREHWAEAVRAVRDGVAEGFDLLTGVDEEESGLRVVLHLWSPARGASVLLTTTCPADDPRVPSVAGLLGGADWAERHAAEMLGLVFEGHPDPSRLLLPPAAPVAPLRRSFVLTARAAQPWPGALEPGESPRRRSRRGARPLGVPEPGTWGPDAGEEPGGRGRRARGGPA